VQLAINSVRGNITSSVSSFSPEELEWMSREKAAWNSKQKYVRGLFAGGTFCYQSQQIFRETGISVYSNSPLDPKYKLKDSNRSVENCFVDMGADEYTLGKPHPMIDGTLRLQRILTEANDPQTASLFLDFILGYNASTDPVGELFDAIFEARHIVKSRNGQLTVIASICGTDGDPQDMETQTRLLKETGAIIFYSNARAASFCCEMLK
jgi:FdrA protein